jgi:hypothetical protein
MNVPACLRRELRVAFSRRAQPVWFRVGKWLLLLGSAARWHDHPAFWPALAALTLLAFLGHLFYRWKTRGWTRPWGGWADLAAGRH